MNNLKISTRLQFLIGVLSLALIVTGVFGMYGMRESNRAFQQVYEQRMVALGELLDVQRLLLRNRGAVAKTIGLGDVANAKALAQEIEQNAAAIDQTWKMFKAANKTDAEEQVARDFASRRASFRVGFLDPAMSALKAGDLETARTLLKEKDDPLYAPLRADIVKLTESQLHEAKAAYLEAQARYETIRIIAIVLIIAGAGLGILLGSTLTRSIAAALNQAVDTANAVAAGDLTQQISVRGKDELSTLLRALARMQDGLRQVVRSVHSGSASVATASTQIAQGNQDLSARTESQASSLEETAASMEELSTTVGQNADNARHANQLALGASSIAEQGGAVVSQVVDTMRTISESSRKIADITGVIDSIAFQTNILAPNAAVEAARAGEQGRGFAVVASEVRSLASRSAEAAREIKTLILDSVERVEQGRSLADQAGATMGEVVDSIRRVTDIMGEISSASVEQSSGVGQVVEAVTQMDHNTQQNAALVEEMAAAAESLRTQAQDLVKVVSVFKLDSFAIAAPARLQQR